MWIPALLTAAIMAQPAPAAAPAAKSAPEPVTLGRKYTKGEKLEYIVKSHLTSESRQMGLDTWLPEDLDIYYKFTMDVKEIKTDGIADVRYQRPTMTQVSGESANSMPKTQVEKSGLDLLLTLTPVNEIISVKDLAPKKPEKPAKSDGAIRNLMAASGRGRQGLQAFLGQFISEIYRLSLFIGSLDSSMDFAPRLAFDPMVPGDTWKRTVGYQPQKKSKEGKTTMQRLDYTYTYKGVVDRDGKKFQRVEATLDLKTDLAAFIHDTFGVKSSVTGLKEIPLTLKAKVEYDLDMITNHTVAARATSEGGFRIVTVDQPTVAVQEERLMGTTELKLLSRKLP